MVWVRVALCNFKISPAPQKKEGVLLIGRACGILLRLYGVGGQLLEGIRSFYENASTSVRVNGDLSESFSVQVGVRQGCVMSPWIFNIYMDGCIREMKVGVWDLGARLNVRGVEQPLVAGLYAGDSSVGRK